LQGWVSPRSVLCVSFPSSFINVSMFPYSVQFWMIVCLMATPRRVIIAFLCFAPLTFPRLSTSRNLDDRLSGSLSVSSDLVCPRGLQLSPSFPFSFINVSMFPHSALFLCLEACLSLQTWFVLEVCSCFRLFHLRSSMFPCFHILCSSG